MREALGIAFVVLCVAWVAIMVLEPFGFRIRLRFTIRDLLWLTVVVALAVGWWVNYRRITSELLAQYQRADDLERINQILEQGHPSKPLISPVDSR